MAWKMIGEPKTRKVTRGLADEFSGMTPAPHDRNIKPDLSAVLKREIDRGTFRTCEWAGSRILDGRARRQRSKTRPSRSET